jgi:hypothetical protein
MKTLRTLTLASAVLLSTLTLTACDITYTGEAVVADKHTVYSNASPEDMGQYDEVYRLNLCPSPTTQTNVDTECFWLSATESTYNASEVGTIVSMVYGEVTGVVDKGDTSNTQ